MSTTHHLPDPLAALASLTLPEIDRRLADVEAERATLRELRRSVRAREAARRKAEARAQRTGGGAMTAPAVALIRRADALPQSEAERKGGEK